MINFRTLKKLNNNDGLTLKNGKLIMYKSGWQVATEGYETTDIKEAVVGADVILNVLPFIAIRDTIELIKDFYD